MFWDYGVSWFFKQLVDNTGTFVALQTARLT